MKPFSFVLLAIIVSMSVSANSSYRAQIQRLQLELSGLESKIEDQRQEEDLLQIKHHKAIVELRELEDGLRKREEKLQELKHELSHFQRAQRQAVMESSQSQFGADLERLEALLFGVKGDLRSDEAAIMKQRQYATEIVSEIENTRIELSSLTARARATDEQTLQVNRKIRGL